MNAIYLVIIAALVLTLAYRYYGAFMAAKVLTLDATRITPAVRHNDGRDYVPTNKWVTFGHHFAAIAGAGPLVGPVLAAQFGYLPGTIWLLIGAVFAGAVHDMVILFASVRHDGLSVAEIAKKEIGKASGLATSIAVLFILVITMAGLAIAVVNALYDSPWGTFTVAVTIPIAIFVGIYLRYLRPGQIGEASAIGVSLVLLGVFVGPMVQHSWLAPYFTFSRGQLAVLLAAYGFVAAALPVWLLLAPRDYLSTYMKIGTILALALGIIIVRPEIQMPALTQFVNGGGPIIPGPVWPYMFITIACGAISGFHSLISSGTTPKMLEKESQARAIAYGGMLTEGFVAIMALISAIVLAPGDYFAINTPPAVFAKMNIPPVSLKELSGLVGMEVAGRPGGAVSLAVGMAKIFSSIGGMGHLMNYWYQFAIMFEALFILTTIDAGTRVARYILQDIIGTYVYAPLKQPNWWPGILFTSSIVTISWGYLLYSGDVASIWPLFGVANQLLAVVALALGTTIILKVSDKKIHSLITLLPMSFLATTVIIAGVMNIKMFFKRGDMLGNINGSVSVILIILVVITLFDSIRKWIELFQTDKAVGMNTEIQQSCVYGETKPDIPS